MIEYIVAHWVEFSALGAAIGAGLITIIGAYVKFTPGKEDDARWAKFLKAIGKGPK